MLRSLLFSGDFKNTLIILLLELPIILFSLSAHECAHGFVAYKCGDSTAKAFGRLTLNPFKHLDLFGTLCMFLVGFGWAKPVPINMRYFKNPKRDLLLVSLAGPVSNFLIAIVFALLRAGIFGLAMLMKVSPFSKVLFILTLATELGIMLNLGLGLFNLIPIPPLDGSKVLMCALPNNAAAKYAQIERYSSYIIMIIVLVSYVFPQIFFPLDWLVKSLFSLLTLWP